MGSEASALVPRSDASLMAVTPYRVRSSFILLTLCLLFFSLTASAQQLLDRSAFTVGATHRDAAGQNWAYIAWQSNDPASIASATFAVYGKTGDADSFNSYVRRSIVRRQTDPQAISALLDRSVKLGFTLPDLNDAVNGLFRDALPAGNTFTLGQKLSTVFRTAPPDKFQTLLGVGRLHAGFNMALGFGAADPINSGATMTYEVREYDAAAGRDLGVLGRVRSLPASTRRCLHRAALGKCGTIRRMMTPLLRRAPVLLSLCGGPRRTHCAARASRTMVSMSGA